MGENRLVTSFAADCGYPNGFTLEVREHGTQQWIAHAIAEPFALVGPEDPCKPSFPELFASRSRVYLQLLGDRVFVCPVEQTDRDGPIPDWFDLGEEFPLATAVARVSKPMLDADGELGTTRPSGDTTIVANATGSQDPPSSADKPGGVALTLRNGHRRGEPLLTSREVTLVGTAAGCTYVVSWSTVSPVHCAIVRTPQTLWVVDLLSGRGTTVNGWPVKYAMLETGSRLGVGRMRFDVQVVSEKAISQTQLDTRTTTSMIRHSQRLPADVPSSSADSEAVVRDFMNEMSVAQQNVLDQTYELFSHMVESQQQAHASQLEAMREQNQQLVDVIKTLAEPRSSEAPEITIQIPEPSAPSHSAGTPDDGQGKPVVEAIDQARKDLPPPDASSEVKQAWMRGRLHEISEQLDSTQKTGFRRFLSKIFRGDQDALR